MTDREIAVDKYLRMLETADNSTARFYHQNLSNLKDSLDLQDPSNQDFILVLEGLIEICESRFTHRDN